MICFSVSKNIPYKTSLILSNLPDITKLLTLSKLMCVHKVRVEQVGLGRGSQACQRVWGGKILVWEHLSKRERTSYIASALGFNFQCQLKHFDQF